jgi:hypothetical protein
MTIEALWKHGNREWPRILSRQVEIAEDIGRMLSASQDRPAINAPQRER